MVYGTTDYDCSAESPKLRDTIEGDGENTYVVKFYDADSTCYAIRMEAGECWGDHPTNGGKYNCMGQCGGGCEEDDWWRVCSNWARDCLKHDVCSWYFSSSGQDADPNCGSDYDHAYWDGATWCLWWWEGQCEGIANSCSMISEVVGGDWTIVLSSGQVTILALGFVCMILASVLIVMCCKR